MTSIRTVLAAVALAGATLAVQPVKAAEAPWCAVITLGMGDAYWDCRYQSLEACRPNVIAGNRGFCNRNPRYGAPVKKKRRS